MASIMSKLAADEDDTLELIGETVASTDTTDLDDLLDTEEFDPGNLLGKVLALINQVHSSLQGCVFFHNVVLLRAQGPDVGSLGSRCVLSSTRRSLVEWGLVSLLSKHLQSKAKSIGK
jgi:hypothetical protein